MKTNCLLFFRLLSACLPHRLVFNGRGAAADGWVKRGEGFGGLAYLWDYAQLECLRRDAV
jgi:hypothetical protein